MTLTSSAEHSAHNTPLIYTSLDSIACTGTTTWTNTKGVSGSGGVLECSSLYHSEVTLSPMSCESWNTAGNVAASTNPSRTSTTLTQPSSLDYLLSPTSLLLNRPVMMWHSLCSIRSSLHRLLRQIPHTLVMLHHPLLSSLHSHMWMEGEVWRGGGGGGGGSGSVGGGGWRGGGYEDVAWREEEEIWWVLTSVPSPLLLYTVLPLLLYCIFVWTSEGEEEWRGEEGKHSIHQHHPSLTSPSSPSPSGEGDVWFPSPAHPGRALLPSPSLLTPSIVCYTTLSERMDRIIYSRLRSTHVLFFFSSSAGRGVWGRKEVYILHYSSPPLICRRRRRSRGVEEGNTRSSEWERMCCYRLVGWEEEEDGWAMESWECVWKERRV